MTVSTSRSAPLASREPQASTATRPEIQALRALAVALVVVYHVAPFTLSGGYIGVDVFFVISGFLITSHIARELTSGRPFSPVGFYARRVRRLLPASLLVLAVIGVVTLIWLPTTLWNDTGRQLLAATFYVQNWVLAADSVDYLAVGASDASPLQHFWSLSVEEQFYIVWPVLLLGATVVLGRRLSIARALQVTIAFVLLTTLAYSVFETATSPSVAYFVTPTRAWELAAGGLLAVTVPVVRDRVLLRTVLGWGGIAAIVTAAVTFDGATPFPGYLAVVPVLGTAAVIMAGDVPHVLSTSWLANRRPVQLVGDISYSIYLWHWPLLVLTPLVIGGPGYALSPLGRIAAAAAALPASYLSKRLVEDRFRRARPTAASNRGTVQQWRRTFAVAAAAMLCVAVVGGVLYGVSEDRIEKASAALDRFEAGDQSCVGAAYLDPACSGRQVGTVQPAPIIARRDAQAQDCQQRFDRSAPIRCDYGDTATATLRVAVVGDSHANQWMPAILDVATERHWHVTTWFKSGCAFADGLGTATCRDWSSSVATALATERFGLVVTSARSGIGYASGTDVDDAADAFVRAWRPLMASGSRIVALADTPQLVDAGLLDPAGCVAGGSEKCEVAESAAFRDDALPVATRRSGATLVDLRGRFCQQGVCPDVIGGVLVYRDQDHMTAVYARTLSRYLAPYIGR